MRTIPVTTVAPLFSRQQLAAEIANPKSLTLRRALSLACRHYRRAEPVEECCHHRDTPCDCDYEQHYRKCWRADERLEDAIAAYDQRDSGADLHSDDPRANLLDVARKALTPRRVPYDRDWHGMRHLLALLAEQGADADYRPEIRRRVDAARTLVADRLVDADGRA